MTIDVYNRTKKRLFLWSELLLLFIYYTVYLYQHIYMIIALLESARKNL
jgi:hypothetical protein